MQNRRKPRRTARNRVRARTRDEYRRLNGTARKGAIRQQVKPFIQNVHHFRDEGVRSDGPPFDHVVIFDEAQRAWNREKTADFMKGHAGFAQSESEFVIWYLDRHTARHRRPRERRSGALVLRGTD